MACLRWISPPSLASILRLLNKMLGISGAENAAYCPYCAYLPSKHVAGWCVDVRDEPLGQV